MNKKIEIDISKFKVLKEINSGGFGSVFEVKDVANNKTYAAKVIKSSDTHSKKLINREISVMSGEQHLKIQLS